MNNLQRSTMHVPGFATQLESVQRGMSNVGIYTQTQGANHFGSSSNPASAMWSNGGGRYVTNSLKPCGFQYAQISSGNQFNNGRRNVKIITELVTIDPEHPNRKVSSADINTALNIGQLKNFDDKVIGVFTNAYGKGEHTLTFGSAKDAECFKNEFSAKRAIHNGKGKSFEIVALDPGKPSMNITLYPVDNLIGKNEVTSMIKDLGLGSVHRVVLCEHKYFPGKRNGFVQVTIDRARIQDIPPGFYYDMVPITILKQNEPLLRRPCYVCQMRNHIGEECPIRLHMQSTDFGTSSPNGNGVEDTGEHGNVLFNSEQSPPNNESLPPKENDLDLSLDQSDNFKGFESGSDVSSRNADDSDVSSDPDDVSLPPTGVDVDNPESSKNERKNPVQFSGKRQIDATKDNGSASSKDTKAKMRKKSSHRSHKHHARDKRNSGNTGNMSAMD